jgi:hypothetical protein
MQRDSISVVAVVHRWRDGLRRLRFASSIGNSMSRKRPQRTARRVLLRAAQKLVREREQLAAVLPGGSAERPIDVSTSAVIEVRVRSQRCPQCEGEYRMEHHRAPAATLRALDVVCQRCGTRRTLWFRIAPGQSN